MYIQGMSSCAVQEIASLGDTRGTRNQLIRFCELTIGDREDCQRNGGYTAYSYRADPSSPNKGNYTEGLGDNYIFHGVELKADGKTKMPGGGYASAFADFIEQEKLGVVVRGGLLVNHRYHSDHICQVFLWNPDRAAVFAWWAKHKAAANAAEPKETKKRNKAVKLE